MRDGGSLAPRKPVKPPAAKSPKPAPEEKPRYHHGDLRQALIDAGLQLISKEGLAALSLREAARRAGVTHAAPYRNFADKEALLGAVAAEGFRLMTAAMRERMAREEQLMERLGASGIAYVLFAVAHPAHFRVMFGPHFTRPPELASLLVEGKIEQSLTQAGGVEALARAQTRLLFAGLGRQARG